MRELVRFAILAFFFILLGFFLLILLGFCRGGPKVKGSLSLEGLSGDVRIFRDEWGVPHLFAQNEKDLFFACGFVHAQERMWQMELTRRAGFGRLSEIFGKATLKNDRFTRNIGLKEAALQDFEKLTPEMKEVVFSYSAGVNAWIRSRKFDWPPEFLLLRFRPQLWSPLDSLIIKEVMALMLCADYRSEALRAKLVRMLGAEKALQILEEELPPPPLEMEEMALSPLSSFLPLQGSNNWVVSGKRTVSGKPLLANDPHLEINLPPTWYEMHLRCPGLDAIGITIPGVPFVIVGHNESVAWGMTNSGADVQDLFLEKLDSSGTMYLDGDEWKPLQKKREDIQVRGKREPEIIEVLWTVRGPILSPEVIQSQSPVSLSWTIYDGGRTLEAFYRLNKARNWPGFKEALSLFDAPSQNFVYADIEGNIGYYLNGKIPRRSPETGVYPYPGWKEKGRWRGYLDEAEKPHRFNPEDGFIVTANNKIIPEGYPHYISHDWDESFRAERIEERLLEREKHDLESFKAIQLDIYSKKGELFLPVLKKIRQAEGKSGRALELITGWDLIMGAGKEPALFNVFMNILHQEVFEDEMGEEFESFDSLFRRKKAGLLRILSDPDSPWFDRRSTDTVETREDILKISLEKAYTWLERNYGPPASWDWMKMHAIRFRHALGQVPLFKFFNRGPYPLNGDSTTVKASFSGRDGTTHGASYRQLIDLSDFNSSICVLTSGQSGYCLSGHYDDQIPLWLEGEYHPMLFDAEDIEARARELLTLRPEVRE